MLDILLSTVPCIRLSPVMRKPAFCICENKGTDQLRECRAADQCLCFCYIDSTCIIPLFSKSNISSLSSYHILWLVIKYKYVKNANKIIEIMTRKSDKNQLGPGKGVGLSPKIYQLMDIHFIFCSYMKMISFAN